MQTYDKRAPATPFNLRIELSCFVKSIMGCIVYHSLFFFKVLSFIAKRPSRGSFHCSAGELLEPGGTDGAQ